jgi:hypothetical protein
MHNDLLSRFFGGAGALDFYPVWLISNSVGA